MFDSWKVNKFLVGKNYKITTDETTEQGIITSYQKGYCYFNTGKKIRLTLTSKLEKILPLTRKEAFKRFKELNKILEDKIDTTGKLYDERMDLMSDYYIMYYPDKGFKLRMGEDLERAKREHDRVLFNNLVMFGSYKPSEFKSPFLNKFNPFLVYEYGLNE